MDIRKSTAVSDDDFYMVLPSNSCPNVHPDNNASKYYVTFPQTILLNLNDNWKVGMTEIDFNNVFLTLNINHGIEYEEYPTEEEEEVDDLKLVYRAGSFREIRCVLCSEFDDTAISELRAEFNIDKVTLIHPRYQLFHITFVDEDIAKKFGFEKGDYFSEFDSDYNLQVVTAEKPTSFDPDEDIELHFQLRYHPPTVINIAEYYFPEAVRLNTPLKFISYLNEKLGNIFAKIEIVGSLMKFTVKPHIARIKFLNGFNIIAGIAKQEHKAVGGKDLIIKGEYKPLLEGGIKNMFIYSSVVAPIQVGDVRAPLLKNISLPSDGINKELAGYKHLTIINPMYVPVAHSTINSIEVNIRSDSGELIPFISGSITTLVLHFKKYGNGGNS